MRVTFCFDGLSAGVSAYGGGVKTTIPFMMEIMQDRDFMAGHFDTSYLETHPDLFNYHDFEEPEDLVLALSAAIAAYEGL